MFITVKYTWHLKYYFRVSIRVLVVIIVVNSKQCVESVLTTPKFIKLMVLDLEPKNFSNK